MSAFRKFLPARRPAALAAAAAFGFFAWSVVGGAIAGTRSVHPVDPQSGHQLMGGKHSLAPFAHAVFCVSYPEQCRPQRRSIRKQGIYIDAARLAHLSSVNADVNRAIRPQPDAPGPLGDKWLLSPERGDCDDYAVTKRARLMNEGWPSQALLLAMATLPDGQEHLVLVARGANGDFVLDNLRRDVVPISRLRYRWTKLQDAANPKYWREVDHRGALVALAPPAYETHSAWREAASRERKAKRIRLAAADWGLRGSLN